MSIRRIFLRRDSASNFASANPVLSEGEPAFDTTNQILKVGDGVTAWNSLSQFQGPQGVAGNNGTDGADGNDGGEVQGSKQPVQTVASANRTTRTGRKTVRLTPSQVAIAKKLGVPLEEYAKYVKE